MTILVLRELKRLFHLHKGKSVSSNYFDVHRKGYWNPSLYTLEKILDELKIELYSFLLAIENDLEIGTMIGTAKGRLHALQE